MNLDTVSARVQTGDIWHLGQHRLICGDNSDESVVARLMSGERADIMFTSPPYDNQRTYTLGKINWTELMINAFRVAPMAEDGQIFVNLGLVHRTGEWHPYWNDWSEAMRESGWKRFGWYVWNQGAGLPGAWHGRLAPCFEFIFHFNRQAKPPKKIVPCKGAGTGKLHSGGLRKKDGSADTVKTHHGAPVQEFKIPDSIISVFREQRPGLPTAHPAVFPVDLPYFFFQVYSNSGELAYEPFCGGGTTILAGEMAGVRVRAIEIEPRYCDIALARWEEIGGTPILHSRCVLDGDRNREVAQTSLFAV